MDMDVGRRKPQGTQRGDTREQLLPDLPAYEVTPLMVGGVLYTTTSLGQVAAIDATTGKTLWSYASVR